MIQVAVAIIEQSGKILIARRQKDDPLKGKWEFPGGKIMEDETHEQCLKRELHEELGIEAEVGDLLYTTQHVYNHIAVELFFYTVKYLDGEIKLKEYRQIRWVGKENLNKYNFLEANVPLLKILGEG